MLDSDGIQADSSGGFHLQVCVECHTALKQSKVPRLALANNLYRGSLPDEFKDLSWVEEMVCAKYRNTAHITRIYQSSDPSQPKVFHGNTCAHDMNVISTASVLPRTPADINGMLSVVFVGPGKLKIDQLGAMFKIRKNKVWQFLVWLTRNNKIYLDMPLDKSIMDLYPDDGPLPDLEAAIIHDNSLDAKQVFLEETAGFSEHPAELIHADDNQPQIFLEKMGLSDPEGSKLSGRAFTALAVKNSHNAADRIDLILIF
jgi:hypothetical protein